MYFRDNGEIRDEKEKEGNKKMSISGPCTMDLTRFPFDNVTCSLTFESFKLVYLSQKMIITNNPK